MSEGATAPSGSAGSRALSAVPPLPAEAQAAVLDWYAARGRSLAFRAARDPYAILVSELMAQQTQVARAADAWPGFVARFPSFVELAAASPAAVLRAWRGLGYNRRALALRRIAIAVEEEHGGRLPEDVAALQRLPGIGPYTARAVAALAFGRPVGAIDTNVRRVLSRAALGLDPRRREPARGSAAGSGGSARRGVGEEDQTPGRVSGPALQRLADASVPAGRAGEWTHALMDIGAVLCRPAAPRCGPCPLRTWCRFARSEAASDVSAVRRDREPRRRRAAEPGAPFASTTRWLRGRIVERLCGAADGDWVELGDQVGEHGPAAVEAALEGLRRDGLAELHPSRSRTARLPLS